MTYPSKLSEQLKVAQSYTEKIKAIETFLNAMALRLEEHMKKLDDLAVQDTAAFDQALGDIKGFKFVIGELTARIVALEGRSGVRRALPDKMSAKAMAAKVGITRDQEKIMVMKFFARQYCEEHDLPITKGKSGEGHKSFEWFPIEAAQFAMDKMKEMK
jgi:hypothetical protein